MSVTAKTASQGAISIQQRVTQGILSTTVRTTLKPAFGLKGLVLKTDIKQTPDGMHFVKMIAAADSAAITNPRIVVACAQELAPVPAPATGPVTKLILERASAKESQQIKPESLTESTEQESERPILKQLAEAKVKADKQVGRKGATKATEAAVTSDPLLETSSEEKFFLEDLEGAFQTRDFVCGFDPPLEVPFDAVMSDLRLQRAIATTESDRRLFNRLQNTLASCKVWAEEAGEPLTPNFILHHFKDEISPLWSSIAWNAVVGQSDAEIEAMTDKERAIAHLRTHHGVTEELAHTYYSQGLRSTADLISSSEVTKDVQLGAMHHSDLSETIHMSEWGLWDQRFREIVASMNAGLRYAPIGKPAHQLVCTTEMSIMLSHIEPLKSADADLLAYLACQGLVAKFRGEGMLVDSCEDGPHGPVLLLRDPTESNGLRKPVRRIRIIYSGNRGFAQLLECPHANAGFVEALHRRADEMGMTLDIHGLIPKVLPGEHTAGLPSYGLFHAKTGLKALEYMQLRVLRTDERNQDTYDAWLARPYVPPQHK